MRYFDLYDITTRDTDKAEGFAIGLTAGTDRERTVDLGWKVNQVWLVRQAIPISDTCRGPVIHKLINEGLLKREQDEKTRVIHIEDALYLWEEESPRPYAMLVLNK